MRALDLAGLRPTVRHANEGHAAFLGLERIRQLRAERGLSFAEAREIAMAGNVFTTHTPVAAGIDLFPPELMKKNFAAKIEAYGITFDELLGLGRQVPEDPNEFFSMAVLGLRLSSRVNGVSKLHAHVSRRLWRGVFPEAPLSEIPIAAITNGVHADTWTAPAIAALGPRREEGADHEELWRRHEALRAALVHAVRSRTAVARKRRGAPGRRDRGGVAAPRPVRPHDLVRPPLRDLQARDPDLPRPRAPRAPRGGPEPSRAASLRGKGPPQGRARQGVPAARRRVRGPSRVSRPRRSPRRLRHAARAPSRLGLRRLAEQPDPAERGLGHVRA